MKRALCLVLLGSVVLTTAATHKPKPAAPGCHHGKQSSTAAKVGAGCHHAKPVAVTIAKPVFSPTAMISEFLRVQVLVPGYGERIKSWETFDYKAKTRAVERAAFLLAHGPTLPPYPWPDCSCTLCNTASTQCHVHDCTCGF